MPAAAPRFTLSVPRIAPSEGDGEAGHTLYCVDVVEDVSGLCWSVQRRYSEFDDLRRSMEGDEEVAPLVFPPKRWFWNTDPGVLEERRQGLELWLLESLRGSQPDAQQELHDFIDASRRLVESGAGAERRADKSLAKLRKAWARLSPRATPGVTTQLHVLASTGQAERLRNVVREVCGGNDWLDVRESEAVHAFDPAKGGGGGAVIAAQPTQHVVDDGGAVTLSLPPELPGPRGAVDASTEVGGSDLHEVLAMAMVMAGPSQPSSRGAAGRRPIGTLDAADPSGRTAFHLACGSGHRECVRVLVLAGCSTSLLDTDGQTGWQWASQPPAQPKVLKELTAMAKRQGEKSALGIEMALAAADGGGSGVTARKSRHKTTSTSAGRQERAVV